jgi:hypothetical protein
LGVLVSTAAILACGAAAGGLGVTALRQGMMRAFAGICALGTKIRARSPPMEEVLNAAQLGSV